MEKFEILLSVLRSLQAKDALKHFVLVGSWCLDIYRRILESPTTIPATRTMDADVLIPKRLPRSVQLNLSSLMEKHGFITQTDFPSGFHRFVHPELNFEFLTNAGAKPDASVHHFQQLGVTVQELRYMNIPLNYPMAVCLENIKFKVPEPEAFALHKLIIHGLRKSADKAQKDLEAAIGLLAYFEDKPKHMQRLRAIYSDFPKKWRKKVNTGLDEVKRFIVVQL